MVNVSLSLGGVRRTKAAPMSACAGISAMVVAFIIVAVLQDEKVIDISSTESIALILGVVMLTLASLGVAILLVVRCQDEDRHIVEPDGVFTPVAGPFTSPRIPRASGDDLMAQDAHALAVVTEPEPRKGGTFGSWSWKVKLLLVLLLLFVLAGVVAIILSQNVDWAAGGRTKPKVRPTDNIRPQPNDSAGARRTRRARRRARRRQTSQYLTDAARPTPRCARARAPAPIRRYV